MITFKQFISESINDRGILKAIFVIGLPGAGKSFTIKRLSGSISPVVVNTDRAIEFLSKKKKIEVSKDTWAEFHDSATRITKNTLTNYLNGMLPLFVDGTSNNVSNILHRIGILESIGYDVGMIYVRTDIDVAKKRVIDRAAEIGRHVDSEFIDKVHAESEANAKFLKGKISFFKTIDNSSPILDNELLMQTFKKVQGFFDEELSNPVGIRNLEHLKKLNQKYLCPEIYSKEILDNKVNGWYKT